MNVYLVKNSKPTLIPSKKVNFSFILSFSDSMKIAMVKNHIPETGTSVIAICPQYLTVGKSMNKQTHKTLARFEQYLSVKCWICQALAIKSIIGIIKIFSGLLFNKN